MNQFDIAREISAIFQKTLQVTSYEKVGDEAVSALIGFARTQGFNESLFIRRDVGNKKRTVDAIAFFELCKSIMPDSFSDRFIQIAKNRGFDFRYKPNTFLIAYV